MKKCIVVLAVAGVIVLSLAVGVFAAGLVWQDIGRGNINVRTVLVDPDNSNIIYIGSRDGIFKSEDGGGSWRSIFSARGTNRGVNFLLFAFSDKDSLYAATGNGLYFSLNRGRNWNRLFKGKNYLENECTALAILPSSLYLGTKAGLFVSLDKGRSWHKESGILGNNQILNVSYNLSEPDYIYIASLNGVFKTSDAGKNWERIFVAHPVENADENNEVIEDEDEPARFSDIKYVTIDQNNLNCLYVATSKGVYRSQNKGKSWEMLSDYGLLSREIKFLLISLKSTIYAVTKSGIFQYTNERWHGLSLGLTAGDIRFLASDNQDNLYAACDKGLFKTKASYGNNNDKDIIVEYYNDEPRINEVQQAAIKYAQVIDPERIENLRRQARLKAVLPDFSLDYDKTVTSYSNTNTTRFTVGPAEWGVSLKWSLSDLIWSEQQRLIDSQVRLMVQLRDDILDEVTKLYFERLRVKMELDNLSIEDRKKRFEKELRLQELSAMLDALTGGYFSQQTKLTP
ncbi:MAG: hypothetical protein Q8O30_09145 [Candidatus Omnitrophota bacterium]|nr:hypothetical protein [Candidatus Omnitrophota bacterium]